MADGAADNARAHGEYRELLFESGLLIGSGVDGIYGTSGTFAAIVAGIERVVAAAGEGEGTEVVRFPPVVPRTLLERTHYVASFPDLLGAVESFDGDDAAHRALLRDLDAGRDWTARLSATDIALASAACHPLYATLAPDLPVGGRRFDLYGYVFRHEPSIDPARMQSFRQYEHVFVGDSAGAVAHRDRWRDRALEIVRSLGIEATVEVASDPFFGRGGRALATIQREQVLKYEVLARTDPVDTLTAIASANCHADHFGREFGLRAASGEAAHSACVGFGVERIALALLWRHGTSIEQWPARTREILAL